MNIVISNTKHELGQKAARLGSQFINEVIDRHGNANIVVATGASQLEMLSELVKAQIDWSSVTGFHLDEYIDLPADHPASFRKYLRERFVEKVKPGRFYYIDGEQDTGAECRRLGAIISDHPIDVAFVGIGENGHLAFNDPPGDFSTREPFICVDLDEACRRQQLNEGWFNSLSEVPRQAISMSINQIMSARHIICTVPDERKTEAVSNTHNGQVTPQVPASILQNHPSTYFFSGPGVGNRALA
jgi:glucosamine-6-phosphate deaminase